MEEETEPLAHTGVQGETGYSSSMLAVAIVASFVVYAPDVLAGIEPPKTFVAGLILGTVILQSIVTGAWRTALASVRATWSTGDLWRRVGLVSLATFLAVVAASTITSIVPYSSLLGTLNRGQGTLFTAVTLLGILASWPTLRTAGGARHVVRAIAAGGIVPAIVAIVQSVGYDLARGGPVTTDRAAGTLGNPVNLGTMMALSAVAAISLAFEAWPEPRGVPTTGARDDPASRNMRLGNNLASNPSAPGSATRGLDINGGSRTRPPGSEIEGIWRVPQSAIPMVLVIAGVTLAIGTRLVGISWPTIEWTIVPASLLASTLIAWSGNAQGHKPRLVGHRIAQVRAYLWVMVAVACIAAIGASRSRGPAVALGVGAGTWFAVAALPRRVGLLRQIGVGLAVGGGMTVSAFVAGSALPATVRAIQALPAGSIGGGGAMGEVQAQADALGRDTLGTREIAWASSLNAFRYGSRVLDPRWLGTAMASSGHQIADLDAIAALSDDRAMSSLLRRAIGYGPESQVALIGNDDAGQPFDRAHTAPLDILLAHGSIGLASALILAVATVVVSVRVGDQVTATVADRAVVPLLIVSSVASLTGVDGTAQVLATWTLVAIALARTVAPSHDATPNDQGITPSDDFAHQTGWSIGAGCAITGVGVAVAALVSDGATDPVTWAIVFASSIMGVYVVSFRPTAVTSNSVVMLVREGIGPVIIATMVMTPAWAALAGGAEARAATFPGRSVDERQAGLSRAVSLDPGVATYRQLRGVWQ